MLCLITHRTNGRPEVAYTSSNFNEAVEALEAMAIDSMIFLMGNDYNKKIHKDSRKMQKGYHLVSATNKMNIFEKNKDGWFVSGCCHSIIEFELIVKRSPRKIEVVDSQMDEVWCEIFRTAAQECAEKAAEKEKNAVSSV